MRDAVAPPSAKRSGRHRERLVVVGNGMAAGRTLEHLLAAAPDGYDVTIFGAEPRVNYDRIMLSPVLAGEKSWRDIVIHDPAWYERHGIDLRAGSRVTAIDRDRRTVTAADGSVTAYDRLLLATGSDPIVIPIPGRDLPSVRVYRDMDDVDAMLGAAAGGGSAVVIGGGLLGLEAAAGLTSRGMDVTVIHLAPTLMERQLDPEAGRLLEDELGRRGIVVRTGANTKAILGEADVTGVLLDDGTVIPARLVVMAVGIRPSTALAKAAGLAVNRGVVVDDGMATSDSSILAVGECVEHRGTCYGLVAPLYEMAKIVAAGLAGDGTARYAGSTISTKLKVTGINVFSAGDFAAGEDREEIVIRDHSRSLYRRLVIRDGSLCGAVLYGETGDGAFFLDLVQKRTPIADLREALIFGPAYAEVQAASASVAGLQSTLEARVMTNSAAASDLAAA